MKSVAYLFFALALSLSCEAASQITVTVTVTGTPTNDSRFVLNGSTRVWTDAISNAAAQILITNGVSPTAAKLYQQAADYGFKGPVILRQPGPNQVAFLGQIGQAMSASIAGAWASLSYATNAVSSTDTGSMSPTVQAAMVTNLFNTIMSDLASPPSAKSDQPNDTNLDLTIPAGQGGSR